MTLACRDRNRVVLEQELAGLPPSGSTAVLCVTGDAAGQGVRPDVTQVFDLDGTRLAALAASLGMSAAVPETPDAPPVGAAAGPGGAEAAGRGRGSACSTTTQPARVAAFVAAARAAGATLPFIAAVAVYTDEPSARVLQRFPGLGLDPAAIERVLAAPDPVAAGIDAAVAEARALLASRAWPG